MGWPSLLQTISAPGGGWTPQILATIIVAGITVAGTVIVAIIPLFNRKTDQQNKDKEDTIVTVKQLTDTVTLLTQENAGLKATIKQQDSEIRWLRKQAEKPT